MYKGCSIKSALENGLLDAYVPEEVRQIPLEEFDYQPNEFFCWTYYNDYESPVEGGVVYTKHCSRKRVRTWQRNEIYSLFYLVESNRALRYKYKNIKYIVAPIFGAEEEEKIEVLLGTRTTHWPRSRVEIALEQGGYLLIKGTKCDSLQQYDAYVRYYQK